MAATRRLATELKRWETSTAPGLRLVGTDEANLFKWRVALTTPETSVYGGAEYTLSIEPNDMYPFEPPKVVFTGPDIPEHPHIYSNGHICLSILYDHWSPALTLESIALSILSMLASSPKKARPAGNDRYVSYAPKDPRESRWIFEDDGV